jgi:uncharacterized membrane protein YdfJ with MMPL/SSD domain
MTAQSADFNELLKSRAPLVFVFVLGLAFVLLLVVFRSIVIPLKAIVLNLLSVGAAYGVLVFVFQYGHFESLLGFESIDGITSWLPLFLFVLLFGLSMDYHVFILSRVREAFDKGYSTDEAVAHGIKSTAGVVTSAAAVMVFVFAIFATLSALDFKQMGVSLAAAVLIDATLIRAVLLPASMKLLGDWNWYFPRRLEWRRRFPSRKPPPSRQRRRRKQVRSVWGSGSTSAPRASGSSSPGNSTWRVPSSFMSGSSRSRAGARSCWCSIFAGLGSWTPVACARSSALCGAAARTVGG